MPKKTNKKPLTKKKLLNLIIFSLAIIIWVGASIIVAQLVVGRLMIWILGADTFSQPVWTAVFSTLSYIVAMLLIILIPGKIYGTKLNSNLGLKGLPTWTDIGLAPIGFIVYLALAALLTFIFTLLPWFNASEVQEIGFNTFLGGGDRMIAFITLVVIAPIAEEIIFRGWMYGKLRTKFSQNLSEKTAIIVSILLVSLTFGFIHLQWNVGVNVFAMSVVACGLREVTGTIYAGILLHMLKNGLAFYLLYVLGM